MIIVTVGMQLPFDRLIEAMDALAPTLGMPVIAQTGLGTYHAKNMEMRPKIAPAEFERLVEGARLVVSHAGIGTVLTASRLATPIVLFPRRADMREHRNDHQMASVRNLEGRPGIFVAIAEPDLPDAIEQALNAGDWSQTPSPKAIQLQRAISTFIETGAI